MIRCTLRLLVAVALLAATPLDGSAQQHYGRTVIDVPEPTDEGRWYGTWYHSTRDIRVALWVREGEEGLPEMRMRYLDVSNVESFATEWDGAAEYIHREKQGQFALTLTGQDEKGIHADWNWVVGEGPSLRYEKGKIYINRAGDGRQLVFHFYEFEKMVNRKRIVTPKVWTFRKMSRRLVRLEELPS